MPWIIGSSAYHTSSEEYPQSRIMGSSLWLAASFPPCVLLLHCYQSSLCSCKSCRLSSIVTRMYNINVFWHFARQEMSNACWNSKTTLSVWRLRHLSRGPSLNDLAERLIDEITSTTAHNGCYYLLSVRRLAPIKSGKTQKVKAMGAVTASSPPLAAVLYVHQQPDASV